MTHLMRNTEPIELSPETSDKHFDGINNSKTGKPPQIKHSKEWYVLEPPNISFCEISSDLQRLWKNEFKDEPLMRKIIFTGLRLIQRIAYHKGYGNDRIIMKAQSPHHPDFSAMEWNLEALPPNIRKEWLLGFLGYFNHISKTADTPPPTSIILELSNNCNYNCRGCGIGSFGIHAERFMQLNDLRRWAALTCENATMIRINGLGESTLHPQFTKCLDILRRYPGGREIITNGSAPIETYNRLIDDGYVILISWDACEAGLFEYIRRGADFDALTNKLRIIARHINICGDCMPVLLFTLRAENIYQLPATITLAARNGIRRLTVNMFKRPDNLDWTGAYRARIEECFERSSITAACEGVDLALPDHIGNTGYLSKDLRQCSGIECPFPKSQVVIRHNGDLTPCNMMNPYLYGNIKEREFSGVWNDAEAKAFRELNQTECQHPFCRDCYYVNVNTHKHSAEPTSSINKER
jgi:radical SAM protein with 4Fe4S-binding SPASM domain